MTTFERRQRLLQVLREQPGIRVPELAGQFEVSEGTIRNDLNALAETGQLMRVRGGGVPADDERGRSPAYAARSQMNRIAKQSIARLAAQLVVDGDSVLLDASTTVFHLAHFWQERRNLTVITNGIEVGRELAKNTSNTVMLLGGVLRPDGTAITGPASEQFLQELHVKLAFVSCSGFSLEAGLTEVDLHEAQVKRKMIASANRVVALIDSSKFGKVDLTPFARSEQITLIFTDSLLETGWVQKLKQAGLALTICAANELSYQN